MVKKMPEAPSTVYTTGLYQPNGLLRPLYLTTVVHEVHLTEPGLFNLPGWCQTIAGSIFLQKGQWASHVGYSLQRDSQASASKISTSVATLQQSFSNRTAHSYGIYLGCLLNPQARRVSLLGTCGNYMPSQNSLNIIWQHAWCRDSQLFEVK